MPIAIEPMTPADWEAVRAIDLEGIATGHATFETDCPGRPRGTPAPRAWPRPPRLSAGSTRIRDRTPG
jgi:hypothetical protein